MASSPPRSRTLPGEVCDYASTKPLYQKWSQNFASATDGKSLGNLRAMHGNVAAGKLVEIAFNDEAKQVEICGKVVDDAEWQKVEEGVYTGFSQGGRYLKRWPDPERPSLMRYTAEPVEVSLVDHPCLPEATFAVIKADGSTELRKFKAGGAGRTIIGAGHGKSRRAAFQGRQGAHQENSRPPGRARPAVLPRRSSIPGANVEPNPEFPPRPARPATRPSTTMRRKRSPRFWGGCSNSTSNSKSSVRWPKRCAASPRASTTWRRG